MHDEPVNAHSGSPGHADPVEGTTTSHGSWRNPSRRTFVLTAVGVLVAASLVAGVLVAWHAWTHPDVFPDANGVGEVMGPRPVARAAVSYPVTWDGPGDPTRVTFHSATASLSVNTAAAHVTFEICVRRPGEIAGAVYGSLRRYCSSVTPLTSGTTMTYHGHPFAHQYVLATILPTRPGMVRLTSVRFTYALPSHHLPRPISDDVALDLWVPVLRRWPTS